MLNLNVQSETAPDVVSIRFYDGKCTVSLADNIAQEADTESGRTYYRYDEVVFDLPDDRKEERADIMADFDGWWAYGAQDAENLPTLEERVTELEDIILDLIGGVI